MADSSKSRPILIPPLVKSDASLEIVREPRAPRPVEHPHCNVHFLFTPHCFACVEAEHTHYAKTTATPIPVSSSEAKLKAKPASSRSFGFTDSITPAVRSTEGYTVTDYDVVNLIDVLIEII